MTDANQIARKPRLLKAVQLELVVLSVIASRCKSIVLAPSYLKIVLKEQFLSTTTRVAQFHLRAVDNGKSRVFEHFLRWIAGETRKSRVLEQRARA
jgi:hypothetical protein